MKVVSSVSCPDDPTNFTAAATTVVDKVQLASLSTIRVGNILITGWNPGNRIGPMQFTELMAVVNVGFLTALNLTCQGTLQSQLGPVLLDSKPLYISTKTNFVSGSSQYNFIKQDLESVNRSKAPFVVVQRHRPM
ncbi:hypothetical protein D5086_016210 [Populus alba]|uniref:Uncharacterized protein n=2 Tax=Populus TaxID=3689 RepID=A0ACC4BTD0_POPAL|nr:hypothetical protein NC653_020781 [Populus alba x Populus x berolinensis]